MGTLSSTLSLDVGELSPTGARDAALLVISSFGRVSWGRTLNASVSSEGWAIAVDAFDRWYLGSAFAGLVMLDGVNYPANSTATDGLVLRLDPP